MNEEKFPLFKVTQKNYGLAYHDHLLAQYELYIKSAENISNRRLSANTYFITVNAAILSFLSLLLQAKWLEVVVWAKLLVTFVGIMVCVIFCFLLASYRRLNESKFDVICTIEEKLPAQLYTYEWNLLSKHPQNIWRYMPFSYIEMAIPILFLLAYSVLLLFVYCYE